MDDDHLPAVDRTRPVLRCFHCDQPVTDDRWTARVFDVPRPMCCAGCKAVAETIVNAGMSAYYQRRTAPATGPDAVPDEIAALTLYDEPELQSRFVRQSADTREATLTIEGLRCGACVWLIERTLVALPGVVAASVNFATERVLLRWDPAQTSLSALLAGIAAIGYRALPFDLREREAQLTRTAKALFRRMFVAGIGMMQVMMYALPVYTASPGDIEWQYEQLMRWASFLLTIPVVTYSAQPFFSGALRDLRARSLGMDVPVAIGLAAAFAASVWATLSRQGEVYFDSVTMFVFLLLGARYLEWIARRRASRAVDAMSAALPERVQRLLSLRVDDGATVPDALALASAGVEAVPATRLQPGDLIRVGVGERIAVDALILDGDTATDQSLLTGESRPVHHRVGDRVPGGAINAGNPVHLQVLRTSGDSTLSTIERLIERAAQTKPALARLADRVASRFVVSLLAFSVLVFGAWWLIDAPRALPVAIAVLVVSCPCALSLATPAALAAASGAATRHGVLITSGLALETIAECTDVVFDKTGTLTEGRPMLSGTRLFAPVTQAAVLQIAAALETGSGHPLALALREAATGLPALPVTGLSSMPGGGVEGMVDGRRFRLGASHHVADWAAPPDAGYAPQAQDTTGSEAWLVEPGRVLACFTLRDRLRPEAAATVAALRDAGLTVHLLSGDHVAAVSAVGAELGIDRCRAAATPTDKLAYLRSLQAAGRRVLMVGDGVNDAPVLACADASVAVGEATALARTSADAVLLATDITMVGSLFTLARQTRRIIVENLAWATLYNLVAIPAAALGWIPPWLAALGMSASSLLVVGNALRLRVHRAPRSP